MSPPLPYSPSSNPLHLHRCQSRAASHTHHPHPHHAVIHAYFFLGRLHRPRFVEPLAASGLLPRRNAIDCYSPAHGLPARPCAAELTRPHLLPYGSPVSRNIGHASHRPELARVRRSPRLSPSSPSALRMPVAAPRNKMRHAVRRFVLHAVAPSRHRVQLHSLSLTAAPLAPAVAPRAQQSSASPPPPAHA